MSSLLPLVVSLVLSAALVLQTWLHNQQTTRWMRLFSEKQGVPPGILEGLSPTLDEKVQPKPDTRKRIRIPVGGMPWQK